MVNRTPMHRLEILLRSGGKARDDIMELLRRQLGPTQAMKNCVECRVARDEEQPELLVYQERWTSREAMEQHVRSEEFRSILVAMDQSDTEPEVRVDDVICTNGIEAIAAIRDQSVEVDAHGRNRGGQPAESSPERKK
jgi:quinol monooxygenase YgiN